MARRYHLPLLVLAVLTAFLAACSGTIDQTITFRADEAWDTTASLAFPAELAPLLGDQLDQELGAIAQQIENGGGDMQWERSDADGALTYDIEASGRGYDILRSISFSDMSVSVTEVDGERQLTFTASPPLDAAASTLTVVGGEIISGNGEIISGDTVRWVNSPVTMQAVLTERGGAGSLPLLPILGGVALIVGGGLLALLLLRRRAAPRPAAVPAPPPSSFILPPSSPPPAGGVGDKAIIAPGAAPAARFCVHCGASLRPAAKFCAACGQAQPE